MDTQDFTRPIFAPVILGTSRQGRASEHAAGFVVDHVSKRPDIRTELIDIRNIRLSIDDAGEALKDAKFSATVNEADALIFVVPEYNHSFPGLLKHVLDTNLKEYIHKAAGVCGVSAGPFGGARMIQNFLPVLRELGLPVFVNVAGRTVEEYVAVAEALDREPVVSGIELNISCPNVKAGGIQFGVAQHATACRDERDARTHGARQRVCFGVRIGHEKGDLLLSRPCGPHVRRRALRGRQGKGELHERLRFPSRLPGQDGQAGRTGTAETAGDGYRAGVGGRVLAIIIFVLNGLRRCGTGIDEKQIPFGHLRGQGRHPLGRSFGERHPDPEIPVRAGPVHLRRHGKRGRPAGADGGHGRQGADRYGDNHE